MRELVEQHLIEQVFLAIGHQGAGEDDLNPGGGLLRGDHGGQPVPRYHAHDRDRTPCAGAEMREIADPDHPRYQLSPLGPEPFRARLVRQTPGQVHPPGEKDTPHGELADIDQIQPATAVSELAVRQVDLTPLLGQLEHCGAVPAQQRVRRLGRSRWGIVEPVEHGPGRPAQYPRVAAAQRGRRPPDRPTTLSLRVTDEIQHAGLDIRVPPRRDQARGESQRDFPWCRCNITACSVTVTHSRVISSRTASSSACSGLLPDRPGTEAASTSRAPCLAVRQTRTTVQRPTPHRSATSRWLACCVSTRTNTTYSSEGANRSRGLPPRPALAPGLGSAIYSNLHKGDQRTHQVVGS
ncbi:MAG: hypothetical protein ACRDTD_12430 [Pseudonocardiaceae bacterium]